MFVEQARSFSLVRNKIQGFQFRWVVNRIAQRPVQYISMSVMICNSFLCSVVRTWEVNVEKAKIRYSRFRDIGLKDLQENEDHDPLIRHHLQS